MQPTRSHLLRLGALTAAAFIATAAQAASPPSDCKISMFELPLTETRPLPTIQVMLDGQRRTMLADTGGFASILWRAVLPTLKLRPGGSAYDVAGVGGVTSAHVATISSLRIGDQELKNQSFLVVDAPAGWTQQDAAGVLGFDFLGQADVQFDLPGKTIRIVKPARCKGDQEVFWPGAFTDTSLLTNAGSSQFLVTVKINGRPTTALVDSGASFSVLTPGAAQLFGVTYKIGPQKVSGVGGLTLSDAIGQINTFSVGGETVKNAYIHVSDVFRNQVFDKIGTRLGTSEVQPSMILGADFLRSHRVLLARSQNRMFISYVAGPMFDATETAPAASSPPAAAPAASPAPRP